MNIQNVKCTCETSNMIVNDISFKVNENDTIPCNNIMQFNVICANCNKKYNIYSYAQIAKPYYISEVLENANN